MILYLLGLRLSLKQRLKGTISILQLTLLAAGLLSVLILYWGNYVDDDFVRTIDEILPDMGEGELCTLKLTGKM